MNSYIVDEKGFIKNKISVDSSDFIESLPDNLKNNYIMEPIPSGLYTPKWDFKKSEWVESLPKKSIKEFKKNEFDIVKHRLTVSIKEKAKEYIVDVAPQHTQLNWILDGAQEDSSVKKKIEEINKIREKCNEILSRLEKVKDLEGLRSFKVDFKK